MCVWVEDADSIRLGDNALNVVYQNRIISSFLQSNRKLGIAGVKGQGKTFLLKVKRSLLQTGKDSDETSVICFPKDSSLIDTLDSTIIRQGLATNEFMINKAIHRPLKEYQVWVNLWKVSIAVTIIASEEFKSYFSDDDFIKLNQISKDLLSLHNRKAKPSTVFSYLLGMDYSDLNLVLRDTVIFVDLLGRIESGVYIFIDKVEQAFSGELNKINSSDVYSLDTSFWQFSQFSLAQAAYDIYTSVNRHIKVFYSIRQEALVGAERLSPNTFRNILGYICELSYTKEDIFDLFCLYVKNEKAENLVAPEKKETKPEEAFLGMQQLNMHISPILLKLFSRIYTVILCGDLTI